MSRFESAEQPLPSTTASQCAAEVQSGERFTFGENWRQFLAVLNEERIAEAEHSLQQMLQKKLAAPSIRLRRSLGLRSATGWASFPGQCGRGGWARATTSR